MSSLVFLPAALCWWALKKIIIIIEIIVTPSFWLHFPTDCFRDPWPTERICSELPKRGGSPVELVIWRSTPDLVSIPAPLDDCTALQLSPYHRFLLFHWRRSWSLAASDIFAFIFFFNPRGQYTTWGKIMMMMTMMIIILNRQFLTRRNIKTVHGRGMPAEDGHPSRY